ncbi:hypothetical protein NOM01_05450 [Sporolactobacillus sp. STSJ-5]|uniref:hypothetical protein n=1 Tax=Sporolactobacillus sp. STSJ-5 TaxID=2965076 RepID=UPI002103E2A8|nr:hypothetical protein [Sporolactobacillus sp. STSJ-5]MCQ2009442.1 hypothetical protein [Sporolactobacillus sp. STSJ-5]
MIKRSLDSHLSDLPDTSKHEIFEVLKVSEEDLMYQNPLSYTAATCLVNNTEFEFAFGADIFLFYIV